MPIQVLDVQTASSLVVSQSGVRAWLQSLVLASSSSLSVQMLPQVVARTLESVDDVLSSSSGLESHLTMGLVHVLNVVLLLLLSVERILPRVLVLKNLGEDSLCRSREPSLIIISSLDVHSSSVNCVELVFDVRRRPRRALASCRTWVTCSLGH